MKTKRLLQALALYKAFDPKKKRKGVDADKLKEMISPEALERANIVCALAELGKEMGKEIDPAEAAAAALFWEAPELTSPDIRPAIPAVFDPQSDGALIETYLAVADRILAYERCLQGCLEGEPDAESITQTLHDSIFNLDLPEVEAFMKHRANE